MATPVGKIYTEIDMDFQPYTRAQKRLYESATSTTLNIEKNFKDLNIRSSREYDLMRAKIENAHRRILADSKSTANDIIRAEKAKHDQLMRLNDEQFGKQTSLIDTLKKNWLAFTGATAAAGAVLYGVYSAIDKTTDAASDLNETVNKSNAVFGSSAKEIIAWSQDSTTAFGLSQKAALENAASIGNMFSQLGAGSDIAAKNSKQMVQLAADLTSFHNVTGGATEVLNSMQSAFRGEYDSLQKYIPTINAASVEQQALAMTGKKSKDALTDLEKALAAMTLMMKGAGAATGDHAKTAGELAGQERRLGGEMENLLGAVGQYFIPAKTAATSALAEWAHSLTDVIKKHQELRNIQEKMGSTDITDPIVLMERQAGALRSRIGQMEFASQDSGLFRRPFSQVALDQTREDMEEQNRIIRAFRAYQGASFDISKGSETDGSATSAKIVKEREKALSDSLKEMMADRGELYYEKEMGLYPKLEAADIEAMSEMIERREHAGKTIQEIEAQNTEYLMGQLKTRGELYYEEGMDNVNSTVMYTVDIAEAHRNMFQDIEKYGKNNFDQKAQLLNSERDHYKNIVGEESDIVEKWYAVKYRQLLIDAGRDSDNFFTGVSAGLAQMEKDSITFGEAGYQSMLAFAENSKTAFSTILFNGLTGELTDFQSVWDSAWKGMLKTVTDVVAEMAAKKLVGAAVEGFDILGDALGWWAEGTSYVKKDHMAVLHTGEMVIPKEEADRIRAMADKLAGGGGDQSRLGASWGDLPDPIPGTRRYAFGEAFRDSFGQSLGATTSLGKTSEINDLGDLFGLALAGVTSVGLKSVLGLGSVSPYGAAFTVFKALLAGAKAVYDYEAPPTVRGMPGDDPMARYSRGYPGDDPSAPTGGSGGGYEGSGGIGDIGGIGTFRTGIDYVPRDMPAFIHRGEAVLNSKDADAYRSGGGGPVRIDQRLQVQFKDREMSRFFVVKAERARIRAEKRGVPLRMQRG